MKPQSARALVWVAGILILLGLVVMSPTGAFALFALAAVSAAIPAAFGPKVPRIVAAVLLVASLALAATFYSEFERERKAYAERAKERATQSAPAPSKVQDTKK